MTKYIYSGAITLLFLGAVLIPNAQAETTSVTAMYEQIKALMLKVQELQKQLATIRGEVNTVLKDGLSEGMTDADIAKLQELLATDPAIYPEGKVTGYFGSFTKDALKRFQSRHGLTITGTLDEETKDMLEEYLGESYGGKIPAGLLRTPGIAKKVEDRFLLGCDKRQNGGKAMGPLCKKLKSQNDDSDEDEDSDNDSDEDEDSVLEVEIEIEDNDTTVEFTFEGDEYKVEINNSTDIDDVLEAVADELDITVSKIDSELKAEITAELKEAVTEADLDDEDGDFNLEIEINNGDTSVEFTFEGKNYSRDIDNSTKTEDVLNAVADEIDDGDDANDLDNDLADAIESMLEDVVEKNDANEAMDAAEDKIDDAENEIEDADNGVDTEPADDLVDDAKDKLAEAKHEFDREKYQDAKSLANEAKSLAGNAIAALTE